MKRRIPLIVSFLFMVCMILGAVPAALAASTDPKLTSMEIGGQKATISESAKTVTVTLKSSVDLSKVKVKYTTAPKDTTIYLTRSKTDFRDPSFIESGDTCNLKTYTVINLSTYAPEGGSYESEYTIKIKTSSADDDDAPSNARVVTSMPATLNVGDEVVWQLNAPGEVIDYTVATNKPSVISVNTKSCSFTAKAVGSATISMIVEYRTSSGSTAKKTYSKTVKVVQPVKSIQATTATKVTVGVKKTVTCKVSVSPSDATDKTITWSSSSPSIARVSSKGVVTGVKKGSCTVTATASNGSKVKFTITVK